MENKRKNNSYKVEEIKECREKVQISKDIQKAQSVKDCIKTVIQKLESMARLARKDLLGPVTSTVPKM